MNKTYSLRYSIVAGGLVAVSELTRKCLKKVTRYSVLMLTVLLFSAEGISGTVNNELAYQLFRDFAENKGLFLPGTTSISVYNKNGELTGILDKAPMPDFSAVNTSGVATLINPQYVASVKHNGGYQNASFGDGENQYNIVDRNNAPSLDFHAPRLDKLVTEVAPATVTAQGAVSGAYKDKERYPVFYRLGSGTQYIKNTDGQLTNVGGAYSWLTGGTTGSLSSYQNGEMITVSSGLVFDYPSNGAMPVYGEAGDSGSPLFGWDTHQNKWVLVGVLTSGNGAGGRGNNWAVIPLDFVEKTFSEDNDTPVIYDHSAGGSLSWTFDDVTGSGSLIQENTVHAMHGQLNGDLNAGKNLVFSGHGGQIDLLNNVAQGAGSLTFKDDYTVLSSAGHIWTGAGLIVDKGVTLNWLVNGAKNDNLHKIGEGTLVVNGSGVNEGGLKVGDGTVILNQQKDENGNVQAFDNVNIASGRPTLVLSDDQQVNPDNISWGYRGGMLDVNGNSLTFHQLKAADYGAVLTNNSDKQATITLDYSLKARDVALNSWSDFRKGTVGELYKYNNPYTNTTDYFILKAESYGYFPTNQTSNNVWEYIGHEQKEAQKLVADRVNAKGYLFHGQLKDNLNVKNHLPENTTGSLILDGSADISGTFTQENGRLTLQGHPVIHAYNTQSVADKLAATGDFSVLTQPTSFDQEDWENRTFSFDRLLLTNSDFGLGRNATLNTFLDATDSNITLGDSRVFIDKKDGNGTAFILEEGVSEAVRDADRSMFNGSAVLTGNTKLNIMNATFNGDITGHIGSHVELSYRSRWNMTRGSTLDSLSASGGMVSLITDNWSPKILTVNAMNANGMHIAMGVNVADNTGDRIDILNQAMGGNNTLDLSNLFDQTVTLKKDLTLASAPAGTAHDYFSFASFNQGFTIFIPDIQVLEQDGKVLWQLKHNVATDNDTGIVTPPVSDSVPSSPPTNNNVNGGGNDGISDEDNGENTPGNEVSTPDNAYPGVNGGGLFQEKDNAPLLKKARNMFASREYILSDGADRWQQIVDTNGAGTSFWAMTGFSHGGYDVFTLKQSGLNIGARKAGGQGTWWGTNVEMYKGTSQAGDYRDDFSLWGVSLLGGKHFTGGGFVDGMTGYRQLLEDFSIRGDLNDLSGKAKSHVMVAGIRTGWSLYIDRMDMTVTPSVSVNGARISSSRLQGKDRAAELNAGNALWLKTGIEVGKTLGNIHMNASIWRTITMKGMPGVTLSDTWKARDYGAKKADRYTATLGISGDISDNLHAQLNLNGSTGGDFKTNAEGVLGIRYDF